MTLTSHRPAREATRPARPVALQPATPPSEPAAAPKRPSLVPVQVLDDVYRIYSGDRVVGYVQVAGHVYVTLFGCVYNTSVEISQCLDLDTAVSRLAAADA